MAIDSRAEGLTTSFSCDHPRADPIPPSSPRLGDALCTLDLNLKAEEKVLLESPSHHNET